MNYTRKVSKNREKNVDPKLTTKTHLKENAERGQKNRKNDADEIHSLTPSFLSGRIQIGMNEPVYFDSDRCEHSLSPSPTAVSISRCLCLSQYQLPDEGKVPKFVIQMS